MQSGLPYIVVEKVVSVLTADLSALHSHLSLTRYQLTGTFSYNNNISTDGLGGGGLRDLGFGEERGGGF